MTKDARPALELAALAASQFHELKNQLGQLALALDEVATSHPDSAAALREPPGSLRYARYDELVAPPMPLTRAARSCLAVCPPAGYRLP